MGRQSFLQQVVNVLLNEPNNRLSVRRLAAALNWDEDKVNRVVDKAMQDSAIPLDRRPGRVIQYSGLENRAAPGIYHDVQHIITKYWAPSRGLRAPSRDLKFPDVRITATHGKQLDGVWSHPDLAMIALPKRRHSVDDPPDLYSIEVEVYTGFDIRSVYQAHAQGLGANESWVFFATSSEATPHMERIERAARTLGIGLVQFGRSGTWGTYETLIEAERRKKVDPEDRKTFLRNTGLDDTKS